MSLICVDTNFMIWAIKEQATPGQEEMVRRTKQLERQIDEAGEKILVPIVVVTELLLSIPPELHQMTINLISKNYAVAQFDVFSAAHYARVWQLKREIIGEQQLEGRTRALIKMDCMIVAIALAHGASRIYSHDSRELKRFAEGEIEVLPIP